MPYESVDPYAYPGTGVLRNKPGIRNEGALREFEYEQTASRLKGLRQQPIAGKFDLEHLKAIHAHIFQDVYEWAGQLRTVRISKGGSDFARPAFIESEGKRLSAGLASDNYLQGLEKPQFVERLAHHYGEWNALHPFREGNGRSTREFVGQLAREAGYELDQTRIDNNKDEWNRAARNSLHGDLEPVKQIFSAAVRPSRAVAFEKLPEAEALAKHPELKGAFDGLKIMHAALAERFPANDKAQGLYIAQARSEILRKLDAGKVLESPLERTRAQWPQVPSASAERRERGLDR